MGSNSNRSNRNNNSRANKPVARTSRPAPRKPRKTSRKAGRSFSLPSFASLLRFRKPSTNTVLRLILGVLVFSIFMVASATIYLTYLSKHLPEWDEASFDQSSTSKFYDKDDSVMSMRFQDQNRTPVAYNQISEDFLTAIVATEDREFYDHQGFSIRGIIRSTITNILTTGRPKGASTITQQLARGVLLTDEDTTSVSYVRKIKEILLSMQIEDRMTKEEILTNYCNTIPFGHGAYGIEAASIAYFNKHAKDLTLIEAALLAGLPQAPNYYDPFKNPEAALARRNIVIDSMVAVDYITKKEGDALKKEPIKLNAGVAASKVTESKELANYQYFVDYATQEAEKIITSKNLESIFSGGYKIYTTMDKNVQSAMESVYNNKSLFPQAMNGVEAESAMVIIDPTTGGIRGLVGGRTYALEMGFNRAVAAKRQPGSAFKPIVVYGPAFEKGLYSPSTIVKDTPDPQLPDGAGGMYSLVNYSGGYVGNTNVRTAVKDSINTVAVRILNEITPRVGFDFAKRLGITNLSENEKDNLAMALGGLQNGVTPLEMARAFGVFANNGILMDSSIIRKIEDSYGNVVYESKVEPKQVISPEVAYMVTNVLIEVVNNGTGKNAALYKRPVAGKTGTTNLVINGVDKPEGNGDLWFVGYTPQLSGAVWIGYDKNSADAYIQKAKYGSGKAAFIWQNVMGIALQGVPVVDFARPAGIVDSQYDPKTGLPTTNQTGLSDIFIKDLFPTRPSGTLDIATSGKAVRSGGNAKLTWTGKSTIEYTIIRVDGGGGQTEIGRVIGLGFTDSAASGAASYIIRAADGDLPIGF